MHWRKPSGMIMETNDLKETVKYCKSLGYKEVSPPVYKDIAPPEGAMKVEGLNETKDPKEGDGSESSGSDERHDRNPDGTPYKSAETGVGAAQPSSAKKGSLKSKK